MRNVQSYLVVNIFAVNRLPRLGDAFSRSQYYMTFFFHFVEMETLSSGCGTIRKGTAGKVPFFSLSCSRLTVQGRRVTPPCAPSFLLLGYCALCEPSKVYSMCEIFPKTEITNNNSKNSVETHRRYKSAPLPSGQCLVYSRLYRNLRSSRKDKGGGSF